MPGPQGEAGLQGSPGNDGAPGEKGTSVSLPIVQVTQRGWSCSFNLSVPTILYLDAVIWAPSSEFVSASIPS